MKIKSPWIQLTNKCNLMCEYCFIEKDNKVMSMDTFRKINKEYSNLLDDKNVDRVQYRIAGGEPCLVIKDYFELITDMIKKYPNRFNVELITNGILLDNEILDYVLENKNNIGLCLSLDSLVDSKNNTGKQVCGKIKEIQLKYIGIGMSISTVMVNDGKYLPEMAEFICKNGLYWDINFNKVENSINVKAIKKNIDKMIRVLKKYKHNIKTVQFNRIDFNKNTGCQAGEKLVAIDTDGVEYPCQTVFGKNDCNVFNKVKCNKCIIRDYCGCGCIYNHLENREKTVCELTKYYFMKGVEYAVTL